MQHVGLSDCQARSKEALRFHFNASFAILNLLKIQDQLDRTDDEKLGHFQWQATRQDAITKPLLTDFFQCWHHE